MMLLHHGQDHSDSSFHQRLQHMQNYVKQTNVLEIEFIKYMLFVMQSCAVLLNRTLALPLQPAFWRGCL